MRLPRPAVLALVCLLPAAASAQAPAPAPAPTSVPQRPAVPVPAHPAHPAPPQHPVQQAAQHQPAHPATPVIRAPKVARPRPQHPPPPPVPVAPAPAPPAPAQPAEPAKGSVTGLPLPRFAALRADEVNLRAGPGTRYPIDWVYKRRNLPVEIEREFEVWRLVADADGVKGWVHEATLTGRRSFVVTGEQRAMRRTADDHAAPVAYLKPGVVGRLLSCAAGADWCQVQVGEYRGYLKRGDFWGSYAGEAVD